MFKPKEKNKRWEKCSQFEQEWWIRWKNRTNLDLQKELIERANHIQKIPIRSFFSIKNKENHSDRPGSQR